MRQLFRQILRYTAEGTLYVEDQNIERHKLKADFPLLRRLAAKHQGNFYTLEERAMLFSELEAKSTQPRRYTQSKPHRLIEWPWILFLLLGLLLSEWTLRKHFGAI